MMLRVSKKRKNIALEIYNKRILDEHKKNNKKNNKKNKNNKRSVFCFALSLSLGASILFGEYENWKENWTRKKTDEEEDDEDTKLKIDFEIETFGWLLTQLLLLLLLLRFEHKFALLAGPIG